MSISEKAESTAEADPTDGTGVLGPTSTTSKIDPTGAAGMIGGTAGNRTAGSTGPTRGDARAGPITAAGVSDRSVSTSLGAGIVMASSTGNASLAEEMRSTNVADPAGGVGASDVNRLTDSATGAVETSRTSRVTGNGAVIGADPTGASVSPEGSENIPSLSVTGPRSGPGGPISAGSPPGSTDTGSSGPSVGKVQSTESLSASSTDPPSNGNGAAAVAG